MDHFSILLAFLFLNTINRHPLQLSPEIFIHNKDVVLVDSFLDGFAFLVCLAASGTSSRSIIITSCITLVFLINT